MVSAIACPFFLIKLITIEPVPLFPVSFLICTSICYLAALYFIAVATVAALTGQYIVRKMIAIFGRASLIIFILAGTIFVSAISLGNMSLP